MKYLMSLILLALLVTNIYSQDLLSFTPKIEKFATIERNERIDKVKEFEKKIKMADSVAANTTNKRLKKLNGEEKDKLKAELRSFCISEITKLNNDITALDSLSRNTKDSKIKGDINNAKAKLEQEMTILTISNTQMESDLGQDLIKYLSKKASSPSFKIAANIQISPNAEDNKNGLAPVIAANYKHDIGHSNNSHFLLQYDFLLSIQSPASASDTNKMITRILSSGPDGVFQAGMKVGFIFTEDAVMYGINGKMNWLNSKSIKSDNLASFAYLSFSHLLLARLGPVIVGYEQEFRFVDSDSKDILALRIDKAMSGNLLIGINTGQMQFQLKYLLNSNGPIESNERMEIKVGAVLDIFN